MDMLITNQANKDFRQFAVKLNVNSYNLGLSVQPIFALASPLPPGSSEVPFSLPMTCAPPTGDAGVADSEIIQIALRTDAHGVVKFALPLPSFMLFQSSGRLDEASFVALWGSLRDEQEQVCSTAKYVSADALRHRLDSNCVWFITSRNNAAGALVSWFCVSFRGESLAVEVELSGKDSTVSVKGNRADMISQVLRGVVALLTT